MYLNDVTTIYRRASSRAGATNWMPTGSPSSSARPDGTEIPGTPARFTGIVVTSLRYMSAGYYDAYYGSAQKVRTLIQRDFDAAFAQVDVIAPGHRRGSPGSSSHR
jgi:Asp-tRNA(Asn)/Glu-tRNA(Gln) amidotransferase A subunit family amidase